VWTGPFEKFLEIIFGQQSLALGVVFDSRCAVLTRVTDFLIADTVAGYYGDATGLPLLPLLTALSTIHCTHGCGLGGYDSPTVSGRFHIA
jgi:hypothetical protein